MWKIFQTRYNSDQFPDTGQFENTIIVVRHNPTESSPELTGLENVEMRTFLRTYDKFKKQINYIELFDDNGSIEQEIDTMLNNKPQPK